MVAPPKIKEIAFCVWFNLGLAGTRETLSLRSSLSVWAHFEFSPNADIAFSLSLSTTPVLFLRAISKETLRRRNGLKNNKKYSLFVTQKRFQRPWNIVVGPQFYAPLQVQLVLYCALLCSFSGRQLVVNPSILHHFIQCSTKQYIVFILHHPGCWCICICSTVYRKAVDVFAVAFCTYLRLIAERTLNAVLTSQNDSIIS